MDTEVPIRRGQLTHKVDTSSKQIEAGKEFSVFVEINNPYDVPVIISSVSTKLPTEFVDVVKEKLMRQEDKLEEDIKNLIKQRLPEIKEIEEKKKNIGRMLVKEFLRLIPIIGGTIVVSSYINDYIRASSINGIAALDYSGLQALTSKDVEQVVETAIRDNKPLHETKKEITDTLQQKLENLKRDVQKPVTLQPGNSTVQIFTIRTKKSILFRPANYTLHIAVDYKVDGLENKDSINYVLSVGSSVKTIAVGSGIGSLFGYLLRDVFAEGRLVKMSAQFAWCDFIVFLIFLVANIILGVFTAIIFSRKKEIQPIVSIEDFWGGLLTGFFVGYAGRNIFDGIIKDSLPIK